MSCNFLVKSWRVNFINDTYIDKVSLLILKILKNKDIYKYFSNIYYNCYYDLEFISVLL